MKRKRRFRNLETFGYFSSAKSALGCSDENSKHSQTARLRQASENGCGLLYFHDSKIIEMIAISNPILRNSKI